MANHKPANERAADQFLAAIERYKKAYPNNYQTISARPLSEGVKEIVRYLRTGE